MIVLPMSPLWPEVTEEIGDVEREDGVLENPTAGKVEDGFLMGSFL